MGVKLGSKVPLHNKVGEPPTGEAARVAKALHSGISSALRAHSADVEALSTVLVPRASYDSMEALTPESSGSVVAIEEALFKRVRASIGIQEGSFHASLALQQGLQDSNFSTIPTAGKSGAYFFYSPGQCYVLKTMDRKDYRCLHRILRSYVGHLEQNSGSLLPRRVPPVL